MNQYIYVVRPTRPAMLTEGPTPEEMNALGGHFQYLDRLTAEGQVILFGRTQNNDAKTFGIAIFEAADDTAAQRVVDEDPAIVHGVFAGEMFPYQIAGMRK